MLFQPKNNPTLAFDYLSPMLLSHFQSILMIQSSVNPRQFIFRTGILNSWRGFRLPDGFSLVLLFLCLPVPTILSAADSDYTDQQLWEKSRDPKVVKEGADLFQLACASCHVPQPQNPALILKDNVWYHGGKPTEIFHSVYAGNTEKGMVAYGMMLGVPKTVQLVAYILSMHSPEDPVIDGNKNPLPTQTTGTAPPPSSTQTTGTAQPPSSTQTTGTAQPPSSTQTTGTFQPSPK